jgi:hypothetical protein
MSSIEYDAPVLATFFGCVTRPLIDFSGPGALYVVVGFFQTVQQLGSKKRALIRFELKCLLEDTVRIVSHGRDLTLLVVFPRQPVRAEGGRREARRGRRRGGA